MAENIGVKHRSSRNRNVKDTGDEMTSSLIQTKNNQVSYIDVETTKDCFTDDTCSEQEETSEKPRCENCGKIFLKLAGVGLCGIVFGIALEKARVFEPKSIRDQMVFQNFIMLKMFLSAVVTGQLCMAILSIVPATKQKFEEASKDFVSCFTDKGFLSSAVGPFLLGIGMSLCGACPGMVLPQVGAWVPNSVFTLLGALIGALSYGLLGSQLSTVTKPKYCIKHQQVHEKLNVPYAAIALPMAVVLAVVVFIIEWFWPYEKDLETLGRDTLLRSNVVTTIAWPPYFGGALVGLLQIPVILLVKDTIGGSSSYVTVVAQLFYTKGAKQMFPYFSRKRLGVSNWWQVIYVTGAIVGGAISAASSDSFGIAKGVPVHMALLGGIIMIWGARFGSGCTSGHGLSGMGLLSWLSFIAVPFMFAGAIVTAFAMQATGALDTYVTSFGDVS
ncbi:thiosulfate transporter TsuA-like isoform X1 [Saccostrea cucullata]|uniref:thiosulfate transporter TsuA-like isoform X1 n=2 Tax=Saccostrea cuccullata TaxID=36930 RepID=UPI002ED085A5